MSYNLATAAAATGLNKSTILRAIKSGRISATKSELGEWQIEPAELHRIYPPVAPTTEQPVASQHDAAVKVAGLEAQVAALREVAELLRAQRDDAMSQRDKWEAQASRLALSKPVQEQAQPQVHQAEQPFGPPVQQAPHPRRPRWWWKRSA